MTRVKRGTTSMKRRRSILSLVKGFKFGIARKERKAQEAIRHAGNHAFQHRKKKKGVFRALWHVRLGAALRQHDINYSTFMGLLHKKDIAINRKMLSILGDEHPQALQSIVEEAKK